MGYASPMTSSRRFNMRIATAVAVTVGIAVSGSASVSAAPTTRSALTECQQVAETGETGYTTTLPDGKLCNVNSSGQVITGPANVTFGTPARYSGSFAIPVVRGDAARYVKVRYIRGKKVYVRKVKLRAGKTWTSTFKFPKKGTWTVIASYKGSRVTMKTKVASLS